MAGTYIYIYTYKYNTEVLINLDITICHYFLYDHWKRKQQSLDLAFMNAAW